jgi:hypothetical protein
MIMTIVISVCLIFWLIGMAYFLLFRSTPVKTKILKKLIELTKDEEGKLIWTPQKDYQGDYEAIDLDTGIRYSFTEWDHGLIYKNRFLHVWSKIKGDRGYARDHLLCIGITPAHLLQRLNVAILENMASSLKTISEQEKENLQTITKALGIGE